MEIAMTRHLDFDQNTVNEEDILVEIERVISEGAVPTARAAREYYTSGRLPHLIERYFRQRGLNNRNRQAEALSVSAQTLNKIFAGADISENMLFRFRIAVHRASLLKNYSQSEVEQILNTPWRNNTESTAVRLARDVVEMADSLIRRLSESNQIGSSGYGISENHKKQLIATLKELIAKIEAPAVNAEETDRALSRIATAVSSNVKDAFEAEAKEVTGQLVRAGRGYIVELVKQKGWAAISSFFT